MINKTKVVILAGGFGKRFNENNKKKILKPLVKVNKVAILERIINIYRTQGINSFILLGGYKFNELKKFANSFKKKHNVNIKAIFTGLKTETAGRLLKISNEIRDCQLFYFTYGDSLASFDLKKARARKNKHNYVISTYKLKLPYGNLKLDKKNRLLGIKEKNSILSINAGFYVLDGSVLSYISSFQESFEKTTISKIISRNQKFFVSLSLKHWMPMDNIYDKKKIEQKLKKNEKLFN